MSLGNEAFIRRGIIWIIIGILVSVAIFFASLKDELYILATGITIFGLIQIMRLGSWTGDGSGGADTDAFLAAGAFARHHPVFDKIPADRRRTMLILDML